MTLVEHKMQKIEQSFNNEKFKILALLGEGGMGSVYKAEQTELNRIVALKILRATELDAHEHQARFELESKILAGLRHEHIISVYSLGYDDK